MPAGATLYGHEEEGAGSSHSVPGRAARSLKPLFPANEKPLFPAEYNNNKITDTGCSESEKYKAQSFYEFSNFTLDDFGLQMEQPNLHGVHTTSAGSRPFSLKVGEACVISPFGVRTLTDFETDMERAWWANEQHQKLLSAIVDAPPEYHPEYVPPQVQTAVPVEVRATPSTERSFQVHPRPRVTNWYKAHFGNQWAGAFTTSPASSH